MNERYAKLFSLPENLYAKGAPVIISAGNLLKDKQTEKVLSQLKIKNISAKTVKALKLCVHALDTMGKPLDGDKEYEYLDLSAKQGEEFGQKAAIHLPNASTRGFSVEVKQVVFSDNSAWESEGEPWEPLPAAEKLSDRLGDAELIKQFQLRFGDRCEVQPQQHKDLWLCACGTWNREETCYCCGKEGAAQISLDLDALKAEKDARLAREKAEREEKEAAARAAAAARAKLTKKVLAIAIPAVLVCVAAVLLITKVLIPGNAYSNAMKLLEAGQYNKAAEEFAALGDFRDSAEQRENALELLEQAKLEETYNNAKELLSAGDYDGALQLMKDHLDYKDFMEVYHEARYEKAKEFVAAKDYMSAAELLEEQLDYKDSQELYWEACYQHILECWEQEDYLAVKETAPRCAGYKNTHDLLVMANSKVDFQNGDYDRALRALDGLSSSFIAENKTLYENQYADCVIYSIHTYETPARDAIDLLETLPASRKNSDFEAEITLLKQLLECEGEYIQTSKYGTYSLRIEYYVIGSGVGAKLEYTNYSGTLEMGKVKWNFSPDEEYNVIIQTTGTYNGNKQNFKFYLNSESAMIKSFSKTYFASRAEQ